MPELKTWTLQATITPDGRLRLHDNGNFNYQEIIYALEMAKKSIIDAITSRRNTDVRDLAREMHVG